MIEKKDIEQLASRFNDASPQEILGYFLDKLGDKLVVASSLGAEDQAITHMAVQLRSDIRIFVLDTGRLHQETYDVLESTRRKYGIRYEVMFPNATAVEAMVADKGINAFYDSIENRKECCGIRKVEPLNRVLSTADAWVTGLRRSQAVTRAVLPIVEWDDAHNMIKINPLAAWSEDDVWGYIRDNEVPYNVLHDQGYPSIGCAPCTRSIEPGEDVRAGRWWWEDPANKECGLHVVDGKMVRKPANKETFE
ncbi:phosphoadenylyl-sulfate reductase [bacterium]|jgi:phosphoadenosine phosphosulfate reductase|nr:phosphoadenylyl-sulfate reductase [bacterium]